MAASGRGAIKRQQLRATKRRKIERARDAQRSVVKREWHDPLSQRGTPVTSSSRANWPECSVRQLSIRLIINYIDAFELIPSPSPSVRPRGAAAPTAPRLVPHFARSPPLSREEKGLASIPRGRCGRRCRPCL